MPQYGVADAIGEIRAKKGKRLRPAAQDAARVPASKDPVETRDTSIPGRVMKHKMTLERKVVTRAKKKGDC